MAPSVPTAGASGSARPRALLAGRRRVVFTAVVATALSGLVAALVLAHWIDVMPNHVELVSAIVAFGVSQLARLQLRVGTEELSVGWVEVGVTAVLCLVAPLWAPAIVLLGCVLALGPRLARVRPGARVGLLYAVAVMVVSTVAAGAVAGAMGSFSQPVRVALDQPRTILPLVLAGFAQFLVGSGLTALWLDAAGRERLPTLWWRVVRSKRLAMAGTTAIAAATAALVSVHIGWLVVLIPVLWILHVVYGHQLRAGDERVTWAMLADATRRLNQLDERGVARAVLLGVARLFRPDSVEVVLRRPHGNRVYRARTLDLLAGVVDRISIKDSDRPTGTVAEDAGPVAGQPVITRRLSVGGFEVGEIRLLTRRARVLSPTDQHAFSAFADAAASAFHDAATHRTLRAMTARSAFDALHDRLTGLPNRSTLLARANAELRRCAPEAPVALVVIDVDGLREVNDSIGYAAGDELLQLIARRLLDRQGGGELLGRLGGDEFALLIMGGPAGDPAPCEGYAVNRARSLRAELAAPILVGGVIIAVEATVGVVVEAAAACDMTELLRRADMALQKAKGEPGRLACYDAAQDALNSDRLALLADLRDALAAPGQIELYVQPTIDLGTGQPLAAELLARWHHPDRGLLPPAEFIGVVEHSDLADGFTLHVLDLAMRLASEWAGQGIHLPVAVNLCARCTLNPQLPALVADRLASHGVPAERLILEITESVAVTEQDQAERVLLDLRRHGVRVCVDDFGTGSASLSFLARFPVDEVKIDRTFVATMTDSPEAAAIVRATVDLARDLGLWVVAEGVERAEQRAALTGLGVSAAQGFLFHPPMPVAEATAILRGSSPAATVRPIPVVRAPSP